MKDNDLENSIIKNIKNNNKNYDLLFSEPEEESKKFDKLEHNLFAVTNKTMGDLNNLKKEMKIFSGYENDYFSYKIIDDLIHRITDITSKESNDTYIKKICLLDKCKKFKKMEIIMKLKQMME